MTSFTGLGSWPGTDIASAVRQVFDLFAERPFLPELPARGPGSDIIGRGLAATGHLAFALTSSGWTLSDVPGIDQRRATARLRDDLDVLEETAEGYEGPLTVTMAGPWTLAAATGLTGLESVLVDPGARRDLVQAWRDGAADLVAQAARRLPGAVVGLQVDEPSLPAVAGGQVPTASGLHTYRRVPRAELSAAYEGLGAQVGAGVSVHSCAPGLDIGLLSAAGVRAVSVDASTLERAGWDAVISHVDGGGELWLGVVATSRPSSPLPGVDAVVRSTLGWLRPLELGPALAGRLTLTPACGLAGFTPDAAVGVAKLLRRVADVVDEQLVA